MPRKVKLCVFLAKFNWIWEMKKKIGIRDMRAKMKGIWDMKGPVSPPPYWHYFSNSNLLFLRNAEAQNILVEMKKK